MTRTSCPSARRLGTSRELAADSETTFATLDGRVRRAIRSSIKQGVRVAVRTDREAVRIAHRLHVHLRKTKYRMLAQPQALFDCLWEQFAPDEGAVTALALVDDEPVAGALFLVWQDTLYYKYSASRSAFLGYRPIEALTWGAVQWAIERGLRRVDWGVSDLDQPGLVAYKRKWATQDGRVVTVVTLDESSTNPDRSAAGCTDTRRNEMRDLLGGMTTLLTEPEVPDAVAARGGELLYRYFG